MKISFAFNKARKTKKNFKIYLDFNHSIDNISNEANFNFQI